VVSWDAFLQRLESHGQSAPGVPKRLRP
jgi:hypothetical protein